MKELKDIYKEDLNIPAEHRKINQLKHVGQLKPKPGHSLFELDVNTGRITKPEIKISYVFVGNERKTLRRKVIQKPGCLYVTALNKKNSIKHFGKLLAMNFPVNKTK